MEEITAAYVRRLLPRRDPMGHKGTFGKVLCICGSVGFSGAAVFAGRAAVRTGSGLVYLGVPEPVWPVAAAKCDEVMPFPLPSREGRLSPEAEEPIRRRAGACDAVLVGCGLGRGPGCDAGDPGCCIPACGPGRRCAGYRRPRPRHRSRHGQWP